MRKLDKIRHMAKVIWLSEQRYLAKKNLLESVNLGDLYGGAIVSIDDSQTPLFGIVVNRRDRDIVVMVHPHMDINVYGKLIEYSRKWQNPEYLESQGFEEEEYSLDEISLPRTEPISLPANKETV